MEDRLDTIEITSPLSKKERQKEPRPLWKKILSIVLKVVIGVALLFAVAYSVEIIVLYSVYTPFYVVGDSMYPTLNSDAKRSTGGEDSHHGNWGNYVFGSNSWYEVDFGFMVTDGYIENLERFDIVVTHYESDGPGEGYKIKRIVGLPGETIYFDDAGDLYVQGVDERTFSYVEQDFSMRDKSMTLVGASYASEAEPYTVPEGSYFLVGDNRSASNDSRNIGAVESTYFRGQALFIVGTCTYTPEVASGAASPSVNWLSFSFPWSFQYL